MAARFPSLLVRQISRGLQFSGGTRWCSFPRSASLRQWNVSQPNLIQQSLTTPSANVTLARSYSSIPTLSCIAKSGTNGGFLQRPLLEASSVIVNPVRTKVLGSIKKCKEKTVKAVVKRFYRLNCGLWIRTKAGRAKKLHLKRSSRKYRLKQHVFVSPTQNRLLNRMTTKFWKKPRYFVDDIYAPYQTRAGFTGDKVELPKSFWP